MSITARLIVTIALLLAAGIFGMTGAVLLDAGPRIEMESESTARLAETLIRSSLVALEAADDPKAKLQTLVAHLSTLRHVKISLVSKLPAVPSGDATRSSIWKSLSAPERASPLEIPVVVGTEHIDTLRITPIPQDEWDEVWDAVGRIFEYGLLLGILLIVLTSFLITRSLRPIHTITDGLHELEGGNFEVEIKVEGPPEIAKSCHQLNTLAKALKNSRAKVKELSARIVHVQDEERREVVRELHDDLGPHLFALRARAASLERDLLKDEPHLDRAIEASAAILEHLDAIQQTNRRVLQRLAPAGLLELGLERALLGMAAAWRKEQPQVALTLSLPPRLADLTESSALTVYRVAQEALTNAYRHAGARNIDLTVTVSSNEDRAQDGVHVVVTDDGCGLKTDLLIGRGIGGMRERVVALGGALDLEARPTGGLRLSAYFPV